MVLVLLDTVVRISLIVKLSEKWRGFRVDVYIFDIRLLFFFFSISSVMIEVPIFR